MTDRAVIRLAKLLFALLTSMMVASFAVVTILTSQGYTTWRDTLPDIGFALATFLFPLVGLLIATRQPRNAVAWVLLGVGFAWQLGAVLSVYAQAGLALPDRLPGPAYAAAISELLWIPGLGPLGTFLILLFPDGHLPSPRWRWWARFSGAALILPALLILVAPGQLSETPSLRNPFAVEALEPLLPVAMGAVLLIPIAIVGCAVALVRRFRRSLGAQRLQMKWLTAAGSVVAAFFLVTMIASIPYDWATSTTPVWLTILQNVSLFTFLLIPVSVGMAITRYRLYEIDRLINRALVYGAVSAVLIAVYVLGVVGAGGAMRAVTGQEQGNLAVAVSTLAVAALFRPFRARVQHFIDRRFYRGKYDAARTVEAFSARLRQETDLTALSDDLRAVVSATVQPANFSLWIASDH